MRRNGLKKSIAALFRDNRGLTLMELLVSLAILGVLSAALVGFLAAGSRSYSSVSATVSLQFESQTVMNQLREYVIDCNGGICFDGESLYVVERENGELSVHMFRFDGEKGELEYVEYEPSYLEGGEWLFRPVPDGGGLMSARMSGFDAEIPAPPPGYTGAYELESVALTLDFVRRNKSYTGRQVIALRNRPLTAATLVTLLDALS